MTDSAAAWWQVSARVPEGKEDACAALLETRLGTPAAVFREEETGAVTVSVYPRALPASARELRAALAAELGLAKEDVEARRLARQNWAESWKRHFRPIEFGGRLLLKPGWSRRKARPGQRVVVLDPGLSFGTGRHETTAYCLRQLLRRRAAHRAQSFLDVGTGSGILAIAAAKVGYAPVAAFDVDEAAVKAARRNARRNRVDRTVRVRKCDLGGFKTTARYDVVCANLTHDILAAEAGRLAGLLTDSGWLIVAGILDGQFHHGCEKFAKLWLDFA